MDVNFCDTSSEILLVLFHRGSNLPPDVQTHAQTPRRTPRRTPNHPGCSSFYHANQTKTTTKQNNWRSPLFLGVCFVALLNLFYNRFAYRCYLPTTYLRTRAQSKLGITRITAIQAPTITGITRITANLSWTKLYTLSLVASKPPVAGLWFGLGGKRVAFTISQHFHAVLSQLRENAFELM